MNIYMYLKCTLTNQCSVRDSEDKAGAEGSQSESEGLLRNTGLVDLLPLLWQFDEDDDVMMGMAPDPLLVPT